MYNAANEIAVARFLKGDISFLQIEDIIEAVLYKHEMYANPTIEHIHEQDHWARSYAASIRF
ncbi:1-deoxy-D-xylulose 5-phosphate reductoisomerase [compost metagenome]